MNLIRQSVVVGATLLLSTQPALAVKVLNQPTPISTSINSTGIIERGGTVNAVDFGKKFIVVDKVKFALPAVPVKVHAPSGGEKVIQLKVGMQIRFNTAKSNYARQEQVQEIWVTSSGSKPPIK